MLLLLYTRWAKVAAPVKNSDLQVGFETLIHAPAQASMMFGLEGTGALQRSSIELLAVASAGRVENQRQLHAWGGWTA